ncbi:hypothetical protein CRG98_009427 [Punica granatum]|uniref:Reverse transcriptase Ty1/copia-type domain-containing protein n=1 Tax=Punica granatum TaxID=22663 RepID=A0A2I0KNU9_PUNGR|nr:hypothetical protein CRG98_009427 [Punica granatum]
MITMSTEELQSLLVGHEERRLYATVQNVAPVTASSAPLSGILGAPSVEVHYVDGRHNQNGHNKGKNKGGKGNGKGSGSGAFGGSSDHGVGRKIPNQGSGGEERQNGSGYVSLGQTHPRIDSRIGPINHGPYFGRPNPINSSARGSFSFGPTQQLGPMQPFRPGSSVLCQICNRAGHTAPFCAPISVDAGRSSSSPAFATGMSNPSSSSITSTSIPIPSSVLIPFHEFGGSATLSTESPILAPEAHDQSTSSRVSTEDAMGTDAAPATQNTHRMMTRSKDGNLPPPRFSISRHPLAFSVSAALQEPQTFAQARKHSTWRAAMEEEYLAYLQNHTWDLVLPLPTQNVVGCKWVYCIKQNG